MINKIIKIISNPKLFVFTIIWMMVLLVLGTIAQKEIGLFAAQNKYFSSIIIWLYFSDGTVSFPILPVPGGMLTMIVLSINLISFLLKANIWKVNKIGVIIVHIGALVLLAGSAVTAIFSEEGQVIIAEGEETNFIINLYEKEFSVVKDNKLDSLEVINFNQNILKKNNVLTYQNIPLDIKILDYYINSELINRQTNNRIYKGEIAEKFDIMNQKPNKEYEQNKAAIKYEIISDNKNISGIYISRIDNSMQTLAVDGIDYTLYIRRQQTLLPFHIKLQNFEHIKHPGTDTPKSFSSEIYLKENNTSKRHLIEMNAPLRYKGYTFYQASFSNEGGKEWTVLAAVKNYGRLFPYIASIIMCVGVLIQMIFRMPRLLRKS